MDGTRDNLTLNHHPPFGLLRKMLNESDLTILEQY